MCLHGKLLEWEDEFNKAEDSHDYEELKDSLNSTLADQMLERFRAAWDESTDSASKLGEVTSSEAEAQAIINWTYLEGKRQVDVFRNKIKAVKMISLDSKSEPKADRTKDKTVDTGHRDIGEAIRPDLTPVSLEDDCKPVQLTKWWEGCERLMNL